MLRIWLVSDQPWMRSGADSGNVSEAQASGRRIGNHRRKVRLSGQLSIYNCPTGELAHARPLLDEFDFKAKKATGLNGRPELCAVNRHEIDKLPASRQPETLNRKDPGSLGQGLDNQDSGHDRPTGKVAVEKVFVDRHRLDGDNRLVKDDFDDPIHEQHRVTMRQGRHDRPDVERSDACLVRCLPHA
jgi:hypothetical protein